jgi:selenocysteine lyase/cysteine desulfurase
MKVRQWFSPRRQYLEDANRPSFEAREPEIFKRMDEFLEKQRQELEQLQAATIEQHENAAEQKLQQQLAAKGGDVSKVITPEQQAQAEIAATQNYL